MSRRYKFYNPEGAYFVSFATVNWIDVFIKDIYLNILANSIAYCREAKGMECFEIGRASCREREGDTAGNGAVDKSGRSNEGRGSKSVAEKVAHTDGSCNGVGRP